MSKLNCGNCREGIFTRENLAWCPVQDEWITFADIRRGKTCDWHSEIQRIVNDKGVLND